MTNPTPKQRLSNIIEKTVNKILRTRNQTKEEILLAFVCKYNCDPKDVVLVETQTETGYEWRIEKRTSQSDKQRLIEAMMEEKKQIGLSYQNDEIERAYFDGRDDQCNTFLKLIEEILPNE